MFWQSLQVTFEIFCSDVAQVGTIFFLDQTRQINWHFVYILMELIEQNICDVDGTYWSAIKRRLSKVMHDLYFISEFCVVPAGLKYASLSLFTVVLSSDNSILCFRPKSLFEIWHVGWIHIKCSFNLVAYMCDLMKVWFL